INFIYRKRRYVCGCCKKRFYEKNELVDRYQRQSKEFKQSIALELIHGKSFKDVADRFHTSTITVIRRFDTINADMLKEPKQLPLLLLMNIKVMYVVKSIRRARVLLHHQDKKIGRNKQSLRR